MTSDSPLIQRVLSGEDPELSLLAARGLLPLPPEELIPLQVYLAEGDDPDLAGCARGALGELGEGLLVPYLRQDAGAEVLAWFAERSDSAEVLETILRRRDVPRDLLVELAPRLPPDLQEVLVHRQDAIVDEPAIADALEDNPELTSYARRRLGEYRQHLLPRHDDGGESAGAAEAEPGDDEELSPEEIRRALDEAREKPSGGEREESTGLSEAQIRFLPVPVRMQLARGASRVLRGIMIRDPNRQVAKVALRANRWSEQEIEHIASNRNMDDEVLGDIGRDREWTAKYRIVKALVGNPRTPVSVSVKLVPRLSVRDLRLLSRDHNVPDAVRSLGRRLYTIKRA